MRHKSTHYYDRDRRKGRKYSAIAHLLFLLLAIFGLPNFMTSQPPEEPMAITVEILPITQISNVKPSQQQPKEEEKPEEKKPTPKEAPPVKTVEAVPPPPVEKPVEKPAEKKKPEEKKPEPKKEKPKPKEDDLAAVLKAVKDTAQKQKDEEKKKTEDSSANKTRSNRTYDPGQPMSLSEIDAIKSQMVKCWNVPAGAKDAQNLVVMLRLQLAADGSVLKVELANESKSRYDSDSFFRAAADSARRAVQECSPLKNLPPEKYATWHDIEMRFDPKEMLF